MNTSESTAGAGHGSDLDTMTVADADAHITETFDEIVSYIDDEAFPDVKRVCEAASLPLNDIMSLARSTPSQPFNEETTGSDILTTEMDVSDKLAKMDEIGVDCGIITPTLSLLLPSVNRPRYAVALANAYNRYIFDTFAVDTNRLKVTLTVATHRPQRAAEEIEQYGDNDHVAGIQLPATGLVPPPGDRYYDPIYEAAENKGLPILFHSGGNTSHLLPVIARTANTYVEEHTVNHPFSHMWNLSTMLFRGVPERFPDLEFVFQEAGIGYIPYMMWRLDDHYLERAYEVPYLDKLPSDYIRDQFYFSTQPVGLTENPGERRTASYIANVVEMIGADQLLFATDLPHPDFDTPEELYDRIRGRLGADEVRAVMGGNAVDVFGFEGF